VARNSSTVASRPLFNSDHSACWRDGGDRPDNLHETDGAPLISLKGGRWRIISLGKDIGSIGRRHKPSSTQWVRHAVETPCYRPADRLGGRNSNVVAKCGGWSGGPSGRSRLAAWRDLRTAEGDRGAVDESRTC